VANKDAGRSPHKKSPRLGDVGNICDAWAEARSPGQAKVCARVARTLKLLAGPLHPRELTALHFQAITSRWRQSLSTSTVWTYTVYLKMLAREISAVSGVAGLAKHIPRARTPEPRKETLTAAELSALLANAEPWFRVFITLCAALGLRHSEALDVKREGWNPDKHTISFIAKGGERQTMPTTEEIDALFANAPPGPPMSGIVELYKGQPINRNSTWWAWQKTMKKSGITRHLCVHDLRRTLAVTSYELTKDLRFVWQVLRHRSLGTTARYLEHVDKEAIRPILQDLWTPRRKGEPIQ